MIIFAWISYNFGVANLDLRSSILDGTLKKSLCNVNYVNEPANYQNSDDNLAITLADDTAAALDSKSSFALMKLLLDEIGELAIQL